MGGDIHGDSDDIEEIAHSVDEVKEIVLTLTPEVCGTRLDKVISTLIPQYSRSRIQQWMEAGHVRVDDKIATTKMIAYGDETVVVLPQPAPDEHAYTPEEMALTVVYEDDDIVIINKPAGLVVHPAAGNWSGTLLNGLLFRWPELGGVPRAGIVHRLDKDTSGLMVVAKNLESQTDLVRQLQ
ncbi:MAG: pseudouridine synthase, partial [Glaciimonas sp.]|nr:pseudouridine synthase [Glaciimonas sp.]